MQSLSAAASETARPLPILQTDGDHAFGIYLHWPFCMAKCPYCDFNSHVRHQPVDQPPVLRVEGLDGRHPLDTGVVDQDVDVQREVLQRGGVREVHRPAVTADLGGDLLGGRSVQIADRDLRAGSGEHAGTRLTDSGRSAGHQRAASFQGAGVCG